MKNNNEITSEDIELWCANRLQDPEALQRIRDDLRENEDGIVRQFLREQSSLAKQVMKNIDWSEVLDDKPKV